MGMIDVRTERAAISARDKLVEAGFIRCVKEKTAPEYVLSRKI